MNTVTHQHSSALQTALPHPGLRARPLPVGEVNPASLGTRPLVNSEPNANDGKLREVFDDFVGQTFYGQLLSSMRSTLDKPAYFHGGRAEEAFQAQLDQVLAEKMADASAEQFTGPMFDLFSMNRR
jgi:flagellar protein FlgJ